jgi:hypothetical protein
MGLENLLKPQWLDASKLQFDENFECVLAVADRFAFVTALDTDLHAIIITIPIAPLPEDGSLVEVTAEVLCGNCPGNFTEGGTRALD